MQKFDTPAAVTAVLDIPAGRITVQDGDVTVGRLGGDAEVSTGRGGITARSL